jgi:hypothetical protein
MLHLTHNGYVDNCGKVDKEQENIFEEEHSVEGLLLKMR